jgi:hypothetical protein
VPAGSSLSDLTDDLFQHTGGLALGDLGKPEDIRFLLRYVLKDAEGNRDSNPQRDNSSTTLSPLVSPGLASFMGPPICVSARCASADSSRRHFGWTFEGPRALMP